VVNFGKHLARNVETLETFCSKVGNASIQAHIKANPAIGLSGQNLERLD
jgi:hypothetical protein